ncbi:ricin-type beta-trefoil lectin domain protein [Kitasatospora azatica]|uniref:ricin-type beta-trefoil lectin domain protein n=1 Tax=Kitasatospora azatica TaxID=58347 RepID=UPI0006898CA6|nr:ricin-type beta-trefoil lectin domain protein [Kitasatospora azatica]
MRERTRAPRRRLGGLISRSTAAAALALTLAGTATPALADTTPAPPSTSTTAGVPGDLDGDGVADVIGNTGLGLVVFPSHAGPYTASQGFNSPEGYYWSSYQVSYRGSLTGSATDDLYAFDHGTSKLFAYPNDANFGGTPGYFTHRDKVTTVAKPATCAPGADCTGYDPTWNTTTQVLATNGIDNADGLPDVVTVENGKLWYYPGKTGAPLGNPVLLGTGNWANTKLIAPGKVGGSPTLWARDNTTGAIASYPLAFNPDGTPTSTLAAPTSTVIQAVTTGTPTGLCIRAGVDFLNPATIACGNGDWDQNWLLGSDGTLHADGECLEGVSSATDSSVGLSACDGRATQKWSIGSGGSLVHGPTGWCLTAQVLSEASSSLKLYPCTKSPQQLWRAANGQTLGPLPAPQTVLQQNPRSKVFVDPAYNSPGDRYGDGNPPLLMTDETIHVYPGRPAVNGLAQFGSDVSLGKASGIDTDLFAGNGMPTGAVLYSKCAALALQADGNLVLTELKSGKTLWSSNTAGHPGSYAALQNDGNLVVSNANGGTTWASNTASRGYHLVVQDDCNTVLYSRDNTPVWSTRTYDPAHDTTGHPIMSGTVLHGGDVLTASRTTLTMGTDGNLVLADAWTGRVLWTSGTAGHPGATAVMQPDGNLVVYAPQGWPLWAPATEGNPGSRTTLQNDGNLVLYNADGRALWSTDTWYGGVISRGTVIPAGTVLHAGDSVQSKAGHLDLQADGNLVLYSKATGHARWSSNTWGHPGATAVMQPDGNLVVYAPQGWPLWSSNTWNHSSTNLVLQDDDNLVLYAHGTGLWASGTPNTLPVERGGVLRAPAVLHAGDMVANTVPNRASILVMQADGNLVLYAPNHIVLWSSNTWGHPGATAALQADGNLVVYAPEGWPMWSSNTWTHPGSNLIMQNDNNLVLYDPDAVPIWATNTNWWH